MLTGRDPLPTASKTNRAVLEELIEHAVGRRSLTGTPRARRDLRSRTDDLTPERNRFQAACHSFGASQAQCRRGTVCGHEDSERLRRLQM